MALSPDSAALPFETIALGAIDADGLVDDAKYNAYHRVFRPDARDQLPLSFFIQSVDTVFKHLLFFRASVRNNSVIDNVLESTVNGIYSFVMSLILLTFMEINPWPLLVSLTSLLVSVSFALGSSVSKYVEVRSRKECLTFL
jgi:small-conductance mechanosensitive channel